MTTDNNLFGIARLGIIFGYRYAVDLSLFGFFAFLRFAIVARRVVWLVFIVFYITFDRFSWRFSVLVRCVLFMGSMCLNWVSVRHVEQKDFSFHALFLAFLVACIHFVVYFIAVYMLASSIKPTTTTRGTKNHTCDVRIHRRPERCVKHSTSSQPLSHSFRRRFTNARTHTQKIVIW